MSGVPESSHASEFRNRASFSNSNCLPLISGASVDNPVMFPPGRAKLAINPLPTGSIPRAMTIGMVEVASFDKARTVGPPVIMTSTLSRTARRPLPENGPVFPLHLDIRSGYCFLPRNPRLADPAGMLRYGPLIEASAVAVTNPIRGIFAGCCASAIGALAKIKSPATKV